MASWSAGDRCHVVEHDDATGQPKPGGRVLPATVECTDEHGFVFAGIPGLGRSIAFRADTGRAFGSNSRWRLVHGTGGEEPAVPPRTVTLDITSPDARHVLTQALEDYAARERDTARHEGGNESRERWADLADQMREQAEAAG